MRRDVAPYRGMTPAQRWEVLCSLLADMDRLLQGRTPREAPENPPFPSRWKDPALGRPS